MDFIAYEDGTIKDELYREEEVRSYGSPTAAKRDRPRVTGNVARKQAYKYGPLMEPKAAPFVCTPAHVEFRDFDVGKSYNAVVKLTNVTGDFSTFRVMPISPEYSEIVSVEYSPPSRISAGLSCPIHVKCKPQAATDISTEITIRTADGYFAIPVKLLTKRSHVVIQPSVVDFGTLVIGDERRKTIVVENTGASSASLTISGSFKKIAEKTQENPLTGKQVPFLTVDALTYRIDVAPFSKQLYDVVFSPFASVALDCGVEFTEKNEDGERRYVVCIKGNATELPVHVTTGDVDFGWCFFQSTYSAEVRVCNRSNVAATVTPVVPDELKNIIRTEPPNTCVQAGGEMPMLLTFTPQRGMPQSFAATLDFRVKGQTLPATLTVRAQLTERAPAIDTTEINCGSFFTNEEVSFPFSVRNESALPQMVGFLSVPDNVRAIPDVQMLLPQETFVFSICVLPPGAGEFSQQMILCNEYGDKEIVTVYGTGETPTFFFSECTIDLPSCPIGSQVSASLVLTNLSKQAQQFAFRTPAPFLTVSPSSGSLKPQEGVVVLVTLIPPEEFVEAKKPAAPIRAPVTPSTNSKTKRLKSNTESRDSAFLSENSTELVPSYANWSHGSTDVWSRRIQFILECHASQNTLRPSKVQVNCTVVKPLSLLRALVVQAPPATGATLTKGARKTLRAHQLEAPTDSAPAPCAHLDTSNCVVTVDFQEVSLNHVTTSMCIIRNNETLPCLYRLQPTDPTSPFTVVRYPLSFIPPGGEDTIVLQFHPVDYGAYAQTLRFTCSTSNDVVIHLRAKCCSTEFAVTLDKSEKADEDSTLSIKQVQFDTTVLGNVSQVPLLYENKGSFPLDITFEHPQCSANVWVRKQTFFFNPSTFTIPPHGSVRSVAFFDPKLEGYNAQSILIKAGGFEHSILFQGRATCVPVYIVLPGIERNPLDEDMREVGLSGGGTRDAPVSLQFAAGETKSIIVGSTKGGPSFECSVDSWDESFEKAGWSIVGASKQTVAAGTTSTVSISLAPHVSGDSALLYCAFRVIIRCSADASNDRTLFIRCAGS